MARHQGDAPQKAAEHTTADLANISHALDTANETITALRADSARAMQAARTLNLKGDPVTVIATINTNTTARMNSVLALYVAVSVPVIVPVIRAPVVWRIIRAPDFRYLLLALDEGGDRTFNANLIEPARLPDYGRKTVRVCRVRQRALTGQERAHPR